LVGGNKAVDRSGQGDLRQRRELLRHCERGVGRWRQHFFFHVIGADSAFRDEAGQSFLALPDAEAHAAVIAAELSRKGENYQGCAVCVFDEEGRELARVPIAGDTS
jgi:hypothetical protein